MCSSRVLTVEPTLCRWLFKALERKRTRNMIPLMKKTGVPLTPATAPSSMSFLALLLAWGLLSRFPTWEDPVQCSWRNPEGLPHSESAGWPSFHRASPSTCSALRHSLPLQLLEWLDHERKAEVSKDHFDLSVVLFHHLLYNFSSLTAIRALGICRIE